MSYFEDDDASQIRELKDKIEDLQAQLLGQPSSIQLENVESGQSIFPGANPSARGGGSGAGGGGGLTEPIRQTVTTLTTATLPAKTNVDVSIGNIYEVTLDENIEFDFTGTMPTTSQYQLIHIIITQDATGGRTVAWPASVSGTPTIAQGANSITDVVLYTVDGSSTWYFVISSGNISGGGISNVVEDLTPELGGNLDALGKNINNLGNVTYSALGFDIADATNPVDNLFVEQVRLQPGVIVANKPMVTSVGGNSVDINHPTGSGVNFSENGTTAKVIIDGGGLITSDNLTLQNTLTFNDNAADPLSNGQFTRNSADVKVFSGGAVRNLSNVGVVAGGATVALDNLSSVSVNDHIIPQAGKTLGNSSNLWSSVWANNYKLGTAGVIDTTINQILGTTNGLRLNTPTGKKIFFEVNGITAFDMSNTTLTGGNIILSDVLTLNDTISHAGANGQFYREGSDLKVFSGGSERNLSDVGPSVTNPLGAALDFNNFDAINVDDIFFNATNTEITQVAGIMTIRVGASDTMRFRRGTQTAITIDSGVNFASAFNLGFYGATAIAKPTVTGSRGGNAALADLLTELANLGLITNSTTA